MSDQQVLMIGGYVLLLLLIANNTYQIERVQKKLGV